MKNYNATHREYYNEKMRAWRKEHPNEAQEQNTKDKRTYNKTDKAKKSFANYHYKRQYGISHKEKLAMIKAQDNKCAICEIEFESPKHVHIDHKHSTGKVRAILCNYCNMGLGQFKDNPNLLSKAIKYLQSFEGSSS